MKSIAIAVASIFAMGFATTTARAEVKKGDHFVELDAKTAAGKNFRLKNMAGKWVLFTFGASWCQPCHKELPAWDRIAPKLAGKGLFGAGNIHNQVGEGRAFVQSRQRR